MTARLRVFAIAAAVIAATSSAAFARYPCAPGYVLHRNGYCYATGARNYYYYSNPVSGAVSGEASGAARGYAAGGPVGAVVGGAIGTATGTLTGTANMLSGR